MIREFIATNSRPNFQLKFFSSSAILLPVKSIKINLLVFPSFLSRTLYLSRSPLRSRINKERD